jgi:hypothetical protein
VGREGSSTGAVPFLFHDPILNHTIWKLLLKGAMSLDGAEKYKSISQPESQRGAEVNSKLYVSVCAQECKFLFCFALHGIV